MTSIPAFHVSGRSAAKGTGKVFIESRQDAVSSGKFAISLSVSFNPVTDAYPTGTIKIGVSLSDSLNGTFTSTSIELINAYGKHNPTIYITGRCKTTAETKLKGLRYWVMIADNKRDNEGFPAVAGFVIHDSNGNRVAYGTGPLETGSINVEPN